MSSLWLAILFTLLANIAAMNLIHGRDQQDEQTDDGDDAESGDGEEPETDPTTTTFSNSTQGVIERRDLWVQEKGRWVKNVQDSKASVLKAADKLGVTSIADKEELKTAYTKLENQINSKPNLASLKPELDGVKSVAGATTPTAPTAPEAPTDSAQLTKLTSVVKVFTDGGPKFFKQLKDDDGFGAAATVCGMISGVAAVIPNPIGMVTSFIFSIASFFINFGAKKAAASKKNPYAEIYKKIDQAVEKITAAHRKIELAKMKTPLATAQDISERFLGLGGKRFTREEFDLWAKTNNIPTMDCFIDPMALVQSYMETMREEVIKDDTGKILTSLYVKIAILRDIVLTAVDLLFPMNTIETPTPDNPDEVNTELKDFCPFKRLRASYRDSLNRQKKKTFEYLLQFHQPTNERIPSTKWYYPTAQDDRDANMINHYLDGLSYVQEDGQVRLMPRVNLHDEVLRKAYCSIMNEEGDALSAKDDEKGFSLEFSNATADVGAVRKPPQRFFSFLPSGSYTYGPRTQGQVNDFTVTPGFMRLRFHDTSIEDFGSYHDVLNVNERGYFVTRYENHLWILTDSYKIKDRNDRRSYFFEQDNGYVFKEFNIMLANSGNYEKPNELEILLAGNPASIAYGNGEGYLGAPMNGGPKFHHSSNKMAKVYKLRINNIATVKEHLRSKFEELGGAGDDDKVDLGLSFRDVIEALHYCQLVGRCTQQ